MNIMHSCRNDDWMTPVPILDMVRSVLGTIDLDPASSAYANERVHAGLIWTREQNGLTQPWCGSVFCNPPGGKLRGKSLAALFWKKLMEERANIDHAIFLCFSAEALQNTQGKGFPSVGDFPLCIPAKRIAFDAPGPVVKKAPSHSNVIVYVPGNKDATERFFDVFRSLGCTR